MTFALYNVTKKKWVIDADSDKGEIWKTTDPYKGAQRLDIFRQQKLLNKDWKDDVIELRRYV